MHIKKSITGIISCHPMMILHGCFFTSYFGLEGNCNVSTSMCPWRMQCAVTLHPPLASSNLVAYFVPLQAQNAHSRILGSVPTNSDFGACKRSARFNTRVTRLHQQITLGSLGCRAIQFYNIHEINFGTLKTRKYT